MKIYRSCAIALILVALSAVPTDTKNRNAEAQIEDFFQISRLQDPDVTNRPLRITISDSGRVMINMEERVIIFDGCK